MDELNSLTYLEYVVREALRCHPPVISTLRTAMKDDIIPLSKSFTDTNGIVHEHIRCVVDIHSFSVRLLMRRKEFRKANQWRSRFFL